MTVVSIFVHATLVNSSSWQALAVLAPSEGGIFLPCSVGPLLSWELHQIHFKKKKRYFLNACYSYKPTQCRVVSAHTRCNGSAEHSSWRCSAAPHSMTTHPLSQHPSPLSLSSQSSGKQTQLLSPSTDTPADCQRSLRRADSSSVGGGRITYSCSGSSLVAWLLICTILSNITQQKQMLTASNAHSSFSLFQFRNSSLFSRTLVCKLKCH